MVKEDIETVIDRLLAYVQANNAVSLNDAAKAMALPETQVEKLALLLEEEGLVNMKYSLTSTKIVSKEFTESQAAKAKEKLAVRPDAVVSESEEAEREVMTAETLLSFIERDITRRLQEAERRLLSLEAKEAYSPEEYKQLEKELRIILQQAAMFEDEVGKLKAREIELRDLVLAFQKRLETVGAKLPSTRPARGAGALLRALRNFFAKIKEMLAKLLPKTKAAQPQAQAVASTASVAGTAEKEKVEKETVEKQKQPLFATVIVPPAPKKIGAETEKTPQTPQVAKASKASLESVFKRLHTSVKNLKNAGAAAKSGAGKKYAIAAKKKTGKK